MTDEPTLYDLIGERGFASLIVGFYRRVRADDILAPMYPDSDWEGAEARLRDFLVGRFGGPLRYVEARGHPRLRMRHHTFPIGQAERDRWVQLMGAAMLDSVKEGAIPQGVADLLTTFFHAVANQMINRS